MTIQRTSWAAACIAAGSGLFVPAAADDLIQRLNTHVEGSIGAEHLSYREINSGFETSLPVGATLDSETGSMIAAGLSLGWQGRLWLVDKLRAELGVHGVFGDTTYNGYSY